MRCRRPDALSACRPTASAINIGLSVSRVGGKTQGRAIKALSERLKLEYAQFLELEIFTRFGQMADAPTRQAIERGRRIRAILQQTQAKPLSLAAQIALLLAVTTGLLDSVPLSAVAAFRSDLDAALQAEHPDLTERVALTRELSDSDRSELCRWLGARIAAVASNAAVQP